MFNNRAIRYGTVFLLVLALTPSVALGAGLGGPIVPCDGTSVGGGKECTVCDIAVLAQNLINTAIFVAVFLSAALFAWAGWKYMMYPFSEAEVKSAKKIFANVALGLIIILAAWLLIDTIMRVLVGSSSTFGPWNKICELIAQGVSLA